MTDGRPHHAECWRDHHDCARAKVERLETQRTAAVRRQNAAEEAMRRDRARSTPWRKTPDGRTGVEAREGGPASGTCFDCEHFNFNLGTPDWSDVTPGDSAEMTCRRGHFDIDYAEELSRKTYRDAINLAADCPDFEEEPR